MNIEVKIDQGEFRRLQRNFQAIKNKELGKPNLRKIFVASARPMVAAIKSKMHFGPESTGALKKSIGIIPFLGVRTGSVFIGVKRDRTTKKTTTFYGKFLEFGTKFIQRGKFTFFEPGVRASVQQVADSIISRLKQAISKYGR